MTAPPPWVARTPRADPDVSVGPTVYADDPPGVVAFLTHDDRCQCGGRGWYEGPPAHHPNCDGTCVQCPIQTQVQCPCSDRPWHKAADGGCYVPDEDEAWDAARCRHCSGTGIWSDEDKQMACPYCGATGEGDTD